MKWCKKKKYFQRKSTTQANILCSEIERAAVYKYLGVCLNKRLEWADYIQPHTKILFLYAFLSGRHQTVVFFHDYFYIDHLPCVSLL